jgi:SAM-dependent methyltransferase
MEGIGRTTRHAAFWREQGLRHIIPGTGIEYHEGFNPGDIVADMAPTGSVVELGCGYGRLAGAFAADRYLGLDINPNAVAAARERNPRHEFRLVRDDEPLPPADTIFSYAVLLHICDDDIMPFLARMCSAAGQVIIGEVMDPRWRREGDPPVYNRDPEEYVIRMSMFGMVIAEYRKLPYARYSEPPWNVGRDSRLTFLRFVRP